MDTSETEGGRGLTLSQGEYQAGVLPGPHPHVKHKMAIFEPYTHTSNNNNTALASSPERYTRFTAYISMVGYIDRPSVLYFVAGKALNRAKNPVKPDRIPRFSTCKQAKIEKGMSLCGSAVT